MSETRQREYHLCHILPDDSHVCMDLFPSWPHLHAARLDGLNPFYIRFITIPILAPLRIFDSLKSQAVCSVLVLRPLNIKVVLFK